MHTAYCSKPSQSVHFYFRLYCSSVCSESLKDGSSSNSETCARKIIRKFFVWLERSQFFGKNALATATEYTLRRRKELKVFLYNGQIEIDNNPAENAIRPMVIGRKNWLFSVSEAGAKANAICLSLAETAKANGIDFYKYLVKLLTDLPNLPINQHPELLESYMPWSENIRATCATTQAA